MLVVLGVARSAGAAGGTCTWNTNSSSTFSTASAWSCSGTTAPPGVNDTAVFGGTRNGNCSISGATTVAALQINGYSGTVTMNAALTVNGALSIGSGTLKEQSNNLTAGSLALTGGTLSVTGGTTSVGGAFTNSGGSLTITGGTVNLTGSGSLSPGSSTSLNNLTINATGQTYTLGSGLLVGGNLTITAGTLAAGSQAVTVSGNWLNSGTFTSTGTVLLNGTSSSGTLQSNGSSFSALTINATGGTYTLLDALQTTGDLTLSAGTLATSSYSVAVGGNLAITAGTYTGGSGSATVTGNLTINNTVSSTSDSSLVGYWKLDETSSPSVDSSGSGNNLVWSGGPTATTSVPSLSYTNSHALAMTGSQYAATSANLSTMTELQPTTITMSAWYKATSVDTTASEIVSGSNTYSLRLTTTGLTVMKRITDNTSQNDWIEYRVPFSNVLDGSWHQITGEIVTGAGGGMTAYLDGVVATGSYYVNGSASGNPKLLSASTSPTASAAATDAVDWDANTTGSPLVIGNNPSTTGYHFGAGCTGTNCAIDDVRIYNRALTSAEIATLANGSQPIRTKGVMSLSGSMSVTGTTTVSSAGSLSLASGSTLNVGTSLTMDGSLISTGGTIQGLSSSYAFKVGSTSGVVPELNINGLTVKNTDANGMWINANTGASTTFTEFDKLSFSSGTPGTGSTLLRIYADSLYLTSSGCTFDGSTTYAVTLTGNGTGSGAGPRVVFGKTTCATTDSSGLCATTEKSDDDANNDGVADNPTTNGAVVEFVRSASSDTSGTIIGFPTPAFDWSTFSYYSTYVTFHDASAGSDVIYVRDGSNNASYSWVDTTTTETIVGTPQWTTLSGSHYLYVGVNGGTSDSGKVYRLKDDTTAKTLAIDTTWNTSGGATNGVYSCGCTFTSDLSLDANNIYWAATVGGAQRLEGIIQTSGKPISSTGWPVTVGVNVTTSSPQIATISSTTTLFLGATARVLSLAVTGTTWNQNSTVTGTITGRVSVGTSLSGTTRLYAGDSSGTVYALLPSSFTSTGSGSTALWTYPAGAAVTDTYYDYATDTVQFGTSTGNVVVLSGGGSGGTYAKLNTSYPYAVSGGVTVAPVYYLGVLAVATSQGRLYFLDRDTGLASPNGVSVIKMYSFGTSEAISTVALDANASRYMVSTSSAAGDGRIYYFDLLSDPTPTHP